MLYLTFVRLIHLMYLTFLSLKIIVDTLIDVGNAKIKTSLLAVIKNYESAFDAVTSIYIP